MRERKPDVITDLWYKSAVIYNCDVRTYLDANGDGVGDFRGLSRRLDYLAGLGITALWLMPFYPSPDRDDGYDITDYYNVDSRYGTLGDFVEFTRAAHQRGIRVIADLVVNHTSDQHPWFKEARSSRGSRHRDWYVWSARRPRDWNKGMVFPGVQKSTWSRDPQSGEWYFHRFYDFQPDLNTSNPAVQAEIRRIIGFWLQLGVSGFRMDAVPFVIGKKGANVKPHEQYDMLRDLRAFLSWRSDDAILLAEANVRPATDMEYFGEYGERLQMMFNFQVNQYLFYALAAADAPALAKAMERTKARPQSAQWGVFLRNNDELDLGRLTEEQREKVFAEFGPDESMQLYDRGIRRRLPPMLNGDQRRLRMAMSLMFTLPGTPVIRYGDELGMGDDLRLEERQAIRTPMQWSTEPHGGFSKADKTILPVIDKGPWGYQSINAAEQRRDPESMLNWTERIIRMRKECPEIGWGDFRILATGQKSVLGVRYEWRNNAVVILHNLGDAPLEVTVHVEEDKLINLFTDAHSERKGKGAHKIELEPYGYRWYRAGGLDYLLKRREY
ncbi:MAG: trehalose synthase [Deltaproteobacteria bacterium]|nr:MAG: trehalose synthase [Deltaproteobacteria bacterium]